jgi:hypothetical protein
MPEYGRTGSRGGYEVMGGAILGESCRSQDGAFLVCVTHSVVADGLSLPCSTILLYLDCLKLINTII